MKTLGDKYQGIKEQRDSLADRLGSFRLKDIRKALAPLALGAVVGCSSSDSKPTQSVVHHKISDYGITVDDLLRTYPNYDLDSMSVRVSDRNSGRSYDIRISRRELLEEMINADIPSIVGRERYESAAAVRDYRQIPGYGDKQLRVFIAKNEAINEMNIELFIALFTGCEISLPDEKIEYSRRLNIRQKDLYEKIFNRLAYGIFPDMKDRDSKLYTGPLTNIDMYESGFLRRVAENAVMNHVVKKQ